jgi:parvulin-like peptidyl-prolyl isomerase
VYAATEAEARTLRARLTAGEPFERVARDVFNDPGLANNGGSLGTFGWGEMEEPLEETAFTLPVGELSEPVRLSMGYAIVRVDHRNLVNPLASETDFAKVKQKLGDAIRARTIPRLLREHARQIAQSMEPQFDDATLAAVYAEWPVLSGEGNAVPVSEQLPPPSPDLRARNLVRLRGTWWTVGTLVERLAETKERQRRRVKNVEDLREVILGLAAREEVFSRALKDGIDRDSTVIAQEKNLATEVRLRHWAAMVQDTVGRGGWPDSLLRHEYERNKHTLQDPPMVNVAEVLVRTEQEAADVARRVRGGADFAGTARARSIRLWAARRGGELGFNTRAGFGILGEKFFQARPGTILGPERVEPYWGVFKILARKEGRQKSFEASRETLVRGVEAAAKQQAFQASLSALRERAQISLDVEALARVDLHSETK